MRSRLALLLIPVAVVLFLLLPRRPVEVPVQLHLGARGAELRQIDLKFERDDTIARDLTLNFPDGAPPDVDRTVRLAPGDYRVAIRLVDRQGHELRDSRPQHVSSDDPIVLDMALRR